MRQFLEIRADKNHIVSFDGYDWKSEQNVSKKWHVNFTPRNVRVKILDWGSSTRLENFQFYGGMYHV